MPQAVCMFANLTAQMKFYVVKTGATLTLDEHHFNPSQCCKSLRKVMKPIRILRDFVQEETWRAIRESVHCQKICIIVSFLYKYLHIRL
jgi:hypothetical protein